MRKRLARTLWILAVAGLPLTACSNKKAAHDGQLTASSYDQKVEADDIGGEAAMPLEEGQMGNADPETTVGRYARKDKAAASVSPTPGVTTGAPMTPPPPTTEPHRGTTEDYTDYGVNPLVDTSADRFSTFAIDVDTASYAIARRKIQQGQLPPPASVRVEEFVNYFSYDYAGPTRKEMPFAVHMDAAPSPFHRDRHIMRVGVQAKKLSIRERKPANLVFLVDVSGSMSSPDKLPLAKRALRLMVDNLKDGDKVSLVTYAGNTRVVLPPTDIADKGRIVSALEDLDANGSTAMASGLELAYDLAAKNLKPDSVSRVIVLSDGDANVGNTSHDRILASIAGKVKEGVTLSTIGFGMGNYKDTMMEQLANKGNGNYYYIDTYNQAKRVFQEQLGGTLEVVAKDVKIQVEMNPKAVKSYRLVGYENRDVADIDFRNDKVDAGEIGAGHSVTAIYELVLADAIPANVDSLATVRIRHKEPRGTKAVENAYGFAPSKIAGSFDGASTDLRFATAVMATAEVLRNSPHARDWSLDRIKQIAKSSSGADNSERAELISLLEQLAPLHKVASR